ncbi:MAG: M48 family metallopeptidase [Planctomycetota bacterium]
MQILLLGIFLAIYLHDAVTQVAYIDARGNTRWAEAMPSDAWPNLPGWVVVSIVLLPKTLLGIVYWQSCRLTRRQLGKPAGQRRFQRTERLTSLLPLLALLLLGVDLFCGGLRHLRVVFHNAIAIDELLLLLPTLLLVVFGWWAYYPIDRRMREAGLLRRADEGLPVYPIWGRRQFVVAQVRHQMLLLLIPLALIMVWSEAVVLLGPSHRGLLSRTQAAWATPIGSLTIFLFAPLVVRYLWDTVPLPDGEVRSRMIDLCRSQKVKVRELLLWRTGGGMVNAAVAGLIAPVRYILLSDALLDQVDRRAIEGVMAHELAHARKHHIFWMLLVLIVTLGLTEQATIGVLFLVERSASPWDTSPWLTYLRDPDVQTFIIAGPTFALTLLVFGWVSRRVERQADVFAARYLSQTAEQPAQDEVGKPAFDAESVGAMVRALQRVADLNHIPVGRRSWRHGSIAWRQEHLNALIGQRLDRARIDRVIGRIKAATLAGVLVIGLTQAWQLGIFDPPEPGDEARPTNRAVQPAIISDSP